MEVFMVNIIKNNKLKKIFILLASICFLGLNATSRSLNINKLDDKVTEETDSVINEIAKSVSKKIFPINQDNKDVAEYTIFGFLSDIFKSDKDKVCLLSNIENDKNSEVAQSIVKNLLNKIRKSLKNLSEFEYDSDGEDQEIIAICKSKDKKDIKFLNKLLNAFSEKDGQKIIETETQSVLSRFKKEPIFEKIKELKTPLISGSTSALSYFIIKINKHYNGIFDKDGLHLNRVSYYSEIALLLSILTLGSYFVVITFKNSPKILSAFKNTKDGVLALIIVGGAVFIVYNSLLYFFR